MAGRLGVLGLGLVVVAAAPGGSRAAAPMVNLSPGRPTRLVVQVSATQSLVCQSRWRDVRLRGVLRGRHRR